MNQEYILLGGLFWKMLRKKVFFWRNHPKGNILTRIAVMLSNKVFYTSPSSFTARFKRAEIMPVGIDVDLFRLVASSQQLVARKSKLLFLGRVSPIKNVHLIIEAARILKEKGIDFILDIVGDPANPEDSEYKKKLIENCKDLIGEGLVNFERAVPNHKTPEIYSNHEIYVNLTPSGSMDKTILEAAACGCMPVVINPYFNGVFDKNMIVSREAGDIAEKLEFWMKSERNIKNYWREKLQNYVKNNHGLPLLIERLTLIIKK